MNSSQPDDSTGDIAACRDKALQLLDKKPHSVYDLRRKLKRREFSAGDIEEVITDLERLRLLDDEALAQSFCEQKMAASPPWGRQKVFYELRRHGISSETAEAALAEVWDQGGREAEYERARQAAENKMRTLSGTIDRRKKSHKIYRYLANRGFSGEIVREVLDEMMSD